MYVSSVTCFLPYYVRYLITLAYLLHIFTCFLPTCVHYLITLANVHHICYMFLTNICTCTLFDYNGLWPGRVAQSVGHLTRKSEVMGSIPGLVTYFCFSFR